MQRIVLTGGPGAGKTTICKLLADRHTDHFLAVPESATHVYSALKTRWDRLDVAGRREVQRQIYRTQLEHERTLAERHPRRTLLLDRGTIDGSAYWPDGSDDYWRALGLSRARELARYDAVLWLESCAAVGAYDAVAATNPVRHEDAASALACGEKLRSVWSGHPRLFEIRACFTFEEKFSRVEDVIRELCAFPQATRSQP